MQEEVFGGGGGSQSYFVLDCKDKRSEYVGIALRHVLFRIDLELVEAEDIVSMLRFDLETSKSEANAPGNCDCRRLPQAAKKRRAATTQINETSGGNGSVL